jgi:hypothetical protein
MTAARPINHVRPARPTLTAVRNNPIESLLARLDSVRNSGRGWTAKCPAHQDRTASLSITAGEDGRVLLHCFAGCCATDVVAAVGLQVGDLFVKRPTADMSFAERAALKESTRQAQWKAALNALPHRGEIPFANHERNRTLGAPRSKQPLSPRPPLGSFGAASV